MRRCILIALILFFIACSAHPTINPIPLKKGKTQKFITFSSETGIPIFSIRKGLTKFTSIGTHIGLPLYGSGFDISRILNQNKTNYSLINASWNYSMNPSYDFTLYSFKKNKRRKNIITYTGYRGMIIPEGVSMGSSLRFGLILGYYKINSWGYEIGYLHDFIQETESNSDESTSNDSGIPDEKNSLTGVVFRIYIPFIKL